jgi:hypothetical protein
MMLLLLVKVELIKLLLNASEKFRTIKFKYQVDN